jgi:glycosyltransferase involved in cell wall biosynthesis
MKIGVAIPCYVGHIAALYELLDSIENQMRIPDKVVVSSSSTDELHVSKEYSFPLEIVVSKEKKNAAENRNIASSHLMDMDYVTFFDADDIMVPERIQVLLEVIDSYHSDILLHNFSTNTSIHSLNPIETIEVRMNTLCQAPSGCITHSLGYSDQIDQIHHSQVTVKKEILEKVKFPEEAQYNEMEDCVFCHRVFDLPNIQNAYIVNPLSYYRPSKTGGHNVL